MDGGPGAPPLPGRGRGAAPGAAVTTWDSIGRDGTDIGLRTIFRDRFLLTSCRPGSERDGTEGELYDVETDPTQWTNRWDDPVLRGVREALIADLRDHLPDEDVAARRPVFAPVCFSVVVGRGHGMRWEGDGTGGRVTVVALT